MKRLIVAALVLCGFACTTNQASAQLGQAAGIDVDASGVLRMKTVADPTGELTRKRLLQSRVALDPQLAAAQSPAQDQLDSARAGRASSARQ